MTTLAQLIAQDIQRHGGLTERNKLARQPQAGWKIKAAGNAAALTLVVAAAMQGSIVLLLFAVFVAVALSALGAWQQEEQDRVEMCRAMSRIYTELDAQPVRVEALRKELNLVSADSITAALIEELAAE